MLYAFQFRFILIYIIISVHFICMLVDSVDSGKLCTLDWLQSLVTKYFLIVLFDNPLK